MASNNRFSMYSNASSALGGPRLSNATAQQSTQLSTTTLLNAVHHIYTSAQPYKLDASTSLVVNSWVTATEVAQVGGTGATVDPELGLRAWEHARRRAEDGCIILGSLHESTPSVFAPFLATLPLPIPSSVYTALNTIRPFIHSASPKNPSYPQHSALGITFTFTLAGNLTAATIALSQGGIATGRGLLNIPEEAGYRAFDVFYYLLTSASTPAEREFLNLQQPSTYTLLARSNTYAPPSFLPTADDAASADDFRAGLKALGIKGASHRDLLSILAGLLKLGDTLTFDFDSDELEEVCEEVGGLLGLESEVLAEQCTTVERGTLIGGLYEALVDWVMLKANEAIRAEISSEKDSDSSHDAASGFRTPRTDEDNGDTVCVTVLEIPDPILGKAAAMRGVFDDTQGINLEMKEDGVDVVTAGSSVLREMENAVTEVAPDLGIMTGPAGRARENEKEKRELILEKVGHEGEDGGFIKRLLFPIEGEGVSLGRTGRIDLPALLASSRVWYHLSLHPTDELPATLANVPILSAWSASSVSRQLRSWRLPEWANRRNKNLDFTADFDHDEFCQRFAPLGCMDGKEGIESWIMERGWCNGEVVIGTERVWMREGAWWEAESMLDLKSADRTHYATDEVVGGAQTGYSEVAPNGSGFFPPMQESHQSSYNDQLLGGRDRAPMAKSVLGGMTTNTRMTSAGDYGLGFKGDIKKGHSYFDHELGEYVNELDPEIAERKIITTSAISMSRRVWVAVVWAFTFWIPSFVLRYVGRMKRPDVRMAWREKLTLVFFIFLLNGFIIFYIIAFGRLLCPNFDKAWNALEVSEHQGENDFYVSLRGHVFDISSFWKIAHGDANMISSQASMQPLAGLNLDEYFVPPLNQACGALNIDPTIAMLPNITETYPNALHTSGYYQAATTSALKSDTWFWDVFEPAIKQYYKGDLVVSSSDISNNGQNGYNNWAVLNGKIYDLTDYFYTLTVKNNLVSYVFLDTSMSNLVKMYPGTDITDRYNALLKAADPAERTLLQNNLQCWDQMFYAGIPDFRQSAKCQVNNYILLAFTIILCAVILTKFLAALQFGSKRVPVQQDKFVICQVPAYTEGEESLRKALDSLTALQYDNKRKLICVICDGMLIGGGNDRPTPKIVLDILGVDPKIEPPALPFHSVGQSSEQLNYGKVYSGLYEFEGNVVPYLVVVKVGKESEQTKSKPGNRGKRDSQILLMSFLNRVHHRSPMNPLELEMFHQINNIIGVDPELYEYMLMVDADTSVREDSLNRLVAKCANDNRIAGICGETNLENEDRSWWTMIQVYEYFISHHLAKAFESLFGSVTCLPGCFTMYRLRTADKGKPLLISDAVIHEYADCNVDTLHKKNLLSLGEDRYLTTLMTKHFPYMSYKFIPDAYASTAAPETWSVLLSQRRRWINSTIHNLAELVWLPDMCGFCCFSMRFIVFIDLFGTLILPATCGYLGYLVYEVATRQGQFPLISIIMLAAVYGLQALVFLLKRQWQHIGWMIIYIMAFPIYSFVLPVYSFWNQDNFSWGNTRIVIGEKGNKQVVAVDDEGFDPKTIPLQRWDEYALNNNLPGRRGAAAPEKFHDNPYDDTYEMDEMKSTYSSIKPSTVLTGFPGRGQQYMAPQSPAPFAQSPGEMQRQSVYSAAPTNPYFEQKAAQNASRHQSMLSGGNGWMQPAASPYHDAPQASHHPSMIHLPPSGSENMLGAQNQASHLRSQSNLGYAGGAHSPLGFDPNGQMPRPVSMFTTLPSAGLSRNEPSRSATPLAFDFQNGNPNGRTGPSNVQIIEAIQGCLAEVDLDTVTKKQVRALVEQRLQCELVGEKRAVLDRGIDEELSKM